MALVAVFIWVRGTLPRLRMDQLMNLAWKFMLPMALLNIPVAGLWHFSEPGPARWLACSLVVGGGYLVLGRALFAGAHLGKRVYRYAE